MPAPPRRSGLGARSAPAREVATPQRVTRVVVPPPPPLVEPAPPSRFLTVIGWLGALALVGLALLVLAAAVVIGLRSLEQLPWLNDFMRTYPGASRLPSGSPKGLPVWLNWSHFLNAFFLLLIVSSGLRVRRETRPQTFWTPRWSKDGRGKVSLTIWFHQTIDALWLLNGVVFLMLIFVTGQWVRIVPTSWDVIPNAVSALIHYVSLDWPHDDGWTNYNALQLLTYFATTFIAAPLAAITGFRMSSLWPKNAKRLAKAYPIEWARRIHFPVMIYFVAFVVVHVALVLATGAVTNLNHMYASRDNGSWIGPVAFLVSLVVMTGTLLALRPIILRPIASLTGRVTGR
jgi:thiosulfate reductase cytochrome b subunit